MLRAACENAISLPKSADMAEVQNIVDIPTELTAPIKKGEVIGKAVYMQNGKVIAQQEIIADTDIQLYKYKKQNTA